jgi:hypothetical protein
MFRLFESHTALIVLGENTLGPFVSLPFSDLLDFLRSGIKKNESAIVFLLNRKGASSTARFI